VFDVETDQCMYGLAARGESGMSAAVKKPTRFLTNAECVADELQWKCNGEHTHQRIMGSERCQSVDTYPPELRRAICRGVAKEFKMKRNVVPIMMLQANASMTNGKLADEWHDDEVPAGARMEAWDDLTGLPLDPKGVLEARQKELSYVEQKKVWTIASRDKANDNGWEIIKTRWIDVNKGDDLDVVYRSRLVGKEFADKRIEGLFAGTPPLEALRFLVHEAATVDDYQSSDVGSSDEKVMMINDVARAFFEAKATRKICVE